MARSRNRPHRSSPHTTHTRRSAQRRSTSQVSVTPSQSDLGSDKSCRKRKRKQNVVEADDAETKRQQTEDQSAAVCGVCLSEEVVERGTLDCCDHLFCFSCIMEWAKVESRCPMCKQRFVTVVRPSITRSKQVRSVRVPLRDKFAQSYDSLDDDEQVYVFSTSEDEISESSYESSDGEEDEDCDDC